MKDYNARQIASLAVFLISVHMYRDHGHETSWLIVAIVWLLLWALTICFMFRGK